MDLNRSFGSNRSFAFDGSALNNTLQQQQQQIQINELLKQSRARAEKGLRLEEKLNDHKRLLSEHERQSAIDKEKIVQLTHQLRDFERVKEQSEEELQNQISQLLTDNARLTTERDSMEQQLEICATDLKEQADVLGELVNEPHHSQHDVMHETLLKGRKESATEVVRRQLTRLNRLNVMLRKHQRIEEERVQVLQLEIQALCANLAYAADSSVGQRKKDPSASFSSSSASSLSALIGNQQQEDKDIGNGSQASRSSSSSRSLPRRKPKVTFTGGTLAARHKQADVRINLQANLINLPPSLSRQGVSATSGTFNTSSSTSKAGVDGGDGKGVYEYEGSEGYGGGGGRELGEAESGCRICLALFVMDDFNVDEYAFLDHTEPIRNAGRNFVFKEKMGVDIHTESVLNSRYAIPQMVKLAAFEMVHNNIRSKHLIGETVLPMRELLDLARAGAEMTLALTHPRTRAEASMLRESDTCIFVKCSLAICKPSLDSGDIDTKVSRTNEGGNGGLRQSQDNPDSNNVEAVIDTLIDPHQAYPTSLLEQPEVTRQIICYLHDQRTSREARVSHLQTQLTNVNTRACNWIKVKTVCRGGESFDKYMCVGSRELCVNRRHRCIRQGTDQARRATGLGRC